MNAWEPGGSETSGMAAGSGDEPAASPGRSEPIQFSVRAAVAADVERVSEIERAAFTDPWSRSSFERFVAEPDARVLFDVACRPDGTVVGYLVAWFIMDEGEIANLAVAPEARSRGVGSTLLGTAIGEARTRAVATIYLEVRESNVAGRALYASRGFTEIGRRRRYYRRPIEDALVLRLVLSEA